MKERALTMPDVMLVAVTRGALGVGVGLLIADSLSSDMRRAIGFTLLALGVMSTVPILMNILDKPIIGEQR
jgi:hypothetical protein